MRKVLFILLLIVLVANASALGVTPARTTLGFNPGTQQEITFTVVNSEYKDINLAVFVKGDLNQSIQLSETEFFMPSTQESKELSYTFTVPESLSPGAHNADIMILEVPAGAPASEAFVGATVAVMHQLVINVPYPGKYLQAQLNIINAEQGSDVTFIMPFVSLGNENIQNVYASIEIYDQNGDIVGETETQALEVAAGARKELIGKWKANVPLGRYLAKATLNYDNNEILMEKEFAIGNATLELQQVIVPNFALGGIAKFEMLIENKWSEPIIGAYAETEVFDSSGTLMVQFKSPTYDIPPLNKSIFVSYWDTAGVEEGTYDTSVYMRYGSKFSQQNLQLQVKDDEIVALGLGFVISERAGRSNLVTVLLIIIAVLIAMNVLWFLVFRKRIQG